MANRRDRRDFTREEVCDLLAYDPASGSFVWKVETHCHGGKILPGDAAGSVKDGYIIIALFGLPYRAHHLAWLIMTGEWPPVETDIDHRDRQRNNNAWSNLRLATRSENNMNAGLRSDNKSGHKGVSWDRKARKWTVRITVKRKIHFLGDYHDITQAIAARQDAEHRLFGEYNAQRK